MNELKPFNSTNIAFKEFFDTNKSMFIEASAGTGKTYTIQQMVARMISEGIELKNILIVTYTEKAAGELKDRIRRKMEEVLESGKINKDFNPEAESARGLNPDLNIINNTQRDYFENALRDVDSASIFTIHSFCQKALRDYAYEAGRPFDMGMIDDDKVEAKIAEWLRFDWLKRKQNENSLFVEILRECDSVSSLIDDIADKLKKAEAKYKGLDNGDEIVSLGLPESLTILGQDIDEDCAKQILAILNDEDEVKFHALLKIDSVASHFEVLQENKDSTFSYIPKSKQASANPSKFIEALEKWNGEGSLSLGRSFGKLENISSSNHDVENAIKFFLSNNDSVKGISEIISKFLPKVKIQKFIYAQIPLLFEEWQKYKVENKFQSYDDMILSVRKNILDKSLGNASTLCLKLREEFSHAIIDEFQDTNQLQWDIFGTIFLGHDRKGVKDHSIIVVGDPKQSIYSFQGADVNVYQKAIGEINNGYCLENNFRSTKSMIEACNALFDDRERQTSESDDPSKDYFKNVFFQNYNTAYRWDETDRTKQGIVFSNSKVGKEKAEPQLYENGMWENTKPFWISSQAMDKDEFAKAAVEKIVDWCTYVKKDGNYVEDENGMPQTKLRVFDKKDESKLRNVTFKDFAILARSRTEMEPIESAMKRAGVPFIRYKDDKLFYGHECAQWIALFKALDAPNFSSYNRKILNEVLITDFFVVPLSKVEDEYFDDPLCKQRQWLAEWKKLAQKRRFAEMQERIYADSGIENRLKDLSLLQSRAKFMQIGNYAVNYLYSNACTLSDVIHQLERLSKKSASIGEEDKDGNLIGKATDADAVQVMTIHASKGLEFPIVISAAGFVGLNDRDDGPYLYHENSNLKIGFSSNSKDKYQEESMEEWKRLYYVDYTRASSILMLPRYKRWQSEDDSKITPEFKFLVDSFENFSKKAPDFAARLFGANRKDIDLRETVKNNILPNLNKIPVETNTEEEQRKTIKKFASSLFQHCIKQHSYSNLGGKQESSVAPIGEVNADKNGPSPDDETNQNTVVPSKDEVLIDRNPIRIEPQNIDQQGNGYDEASIKFPKGGKLGNAIHSIFELTKFKEFGLLESPETALQHPEFSELVEKQFKVQGFNIDKHPEWKAHAAEIVYNTLHGELPEIQGNHTTQNRSFQLVEIEEAARRAEVQFNFTKDSNPIEKGSHLHEICKGFIDLVFVRNNSGEELYSILDWKTDFIADNEYTFEKIKEKVDKEYSVQRVLYCYLLIKWLKQFKKLSESEIFDKHFGGIYYAFVRGCKAGYGNGFYAQTWDSWNALEAEYTNIKNTLMK